MKVDATNGWLLNKRLSGETSLRVSIFTREHGIVDALYKGGRMPKKHAILQPFTPLWLVLDTRHDWHYVRTMECEAPSLMLSGHALFAGLYVNEILHAMLKPFDASSELYTAYVHTLQSLTQHSLALEPILRHFEKILLDVTGYALSWTHESTGRPIETAQCYQFIPGTGFVVSHTGFSGRHILSFSEEQWDNTEVLRTAKLIMRKAIAHAMDGREIQARKLFI